MFTYEPLAKNPDSLRLLVLQPGARDEGIVATLEHHTFASSPKYEALSYTSVERTTASSDDYDSEPREGYDLSDEDVDGRTDTYVYWNEREDPIYGPLHASEVPKTTIKVNDQSFEIGENLYSALWCLRQDQPRALWIDIVCINFSDVDERNAQVTLMSGIYGRAQRVIVWLGIPPQPLPKGNDYWSTGIYGQNVETFVRHPYWNRLWAIQEIALARSVRLQFGLRQYTWQRIIGGLIAGEYNHELSEKAGPIWVLRDSRGFHRFETLLEDFQEFKCTEQRDKIFSLLGLAIDWDGDIITVDYNSSFFRLYEQTIEFHQAAQPLGYDFGIVHKEIDRSAKLVKFSQLVQRAFGGKLEANARPINDQRLYTVRGALAGEIIYLGPTHTQVVSSARYNEVWRKAAETYYADNPEDLAILRNAHQEYSQRIMDWDAESVSKICDFNTAIAHGYQHTSSNEPAFIPSDIPPEPESTPSDGSPRRFLGTRALIGVAPLAARVGDAVYTFYECDVAIVLRKHSEDKWSVVGRADVCTKEHDHWKRERVWKDAINYNPAEERVSYLRPEHYEEIIAEMMNIKLDIGTLQKLTC